MSHNDNPAFRGIERRLTLGYVGVLAGILVVFATVLLVGEWLQSQEMQDRFLVERSRTAGDGKPQRPDDPGDFGFDTYTVVFPVSGGELGTVENTQGSSLGLPFEDAARETLRRNIPLITTESGPDGNIRVASVPKTVNGRVVSVVQSGQATGQVRSQVVMLALIVIPVGSAALILAAIGGLAVSRRAMRPVKASFDRQRSFVADASHELKTPLTLIRADAEVLGRGDIPEEDSELVQDILEETDRMSEILSDLLLLARLDAESLSVARKTFDLTGLVRETVERFDSRAASNAMTLETTSSETIMAKGDKERTGQILAAVLDNALRYSPPGGNIEISVDRTAAESIVTVTDEGSGIPEEHLQKVFDRFYRADESRTREGGGTGLGLAIARDLARAQGGNLTSVPPLKGSGAVFGLTLPAADEG